jgi:cytochrome c-type biogenesis protein CcmE
MNKMQKWRLYHVVLFATGLTIALGLILYALKQNINVFLTPSQIVIAQVNHDRFRLGGMVKKGSVSHSKETLAVQFVVTDLKKEIAVHYVGVLPDLFREGKGVIADGKLDRDGVFTASSVLAKHDENYMPKNVYKALRDGTAA